MVSIDAFQALDLGSIPGRRIEYFFKVSFFKFIYVPKNTLKNIRRIEHGNTGN